MALPCLAILVWLLTLVAVPASWAQAPASAWVRPSATGNLLYTFDERGQRVADFSNVGYRGGLAPLPDVTRLVESNRWIQVSPIAGDDTTNIQAALAWVAAQPLNSNGFRGVVFLKAGEYQLSNSLTLSAAGIVLKGAGSSATNGSRLRATAARQYTLINVDGSGSRATVSGTTHFLTQKLVPAGTRTFSVEATSGLAVGHLVRIQRPSTERWLADIGMDQLGPASGGENDVLPWVAGSRDLFFDRVITRLEGNWITVDAPLPQTFELSYGGGRVSRYTWNRAENIGIEDLYGVSDFAHSTDEDHGWTFISLRDVQHSWVRNITAQHFGFSAVVLNDGAKWITVADSRNLDPVSVLDGGRRYSFNNNGAELALFLNNEARQGRHDFILGSEVAGPNAFVHGTAEAVYADTGPHHRWSVGALFDLMTVGGNEINVQNRGNQGTGHGWAGAYMTVWNSVASSFRVRNPPTARNWLVGSVGTVQSSSCCAVGADPAGTYDLSGVDGQPVHPRSLYHAQLQQRARWPFSEFREYWLGDIDQFSSTNAAGEPVPVDAGWRAAAAAASGLPAEPRFDDLAGGHATAFSFAFALATHEQVRAASLTLSLRALGSTGPGALYLEDMARPLSSASLGWTFAAGGSAVHTIEVDPALLADGRLDVAVDGDTALDFAALHLQVSPTQPFLTNALTPVADATVRAGAYANVRDGTAATLETRDVTASDAHRQAFLRWDLGAVPGRPVFAKVRLHCVSTGQAGNENVASFVGNDAWSQTNLTYNNRPAAGKLFAQWLPVAGQAVEFVVTPLVTEALLNDRQLSLRLSAADNFGSLGQVAYAASEDPNPARRPQLLLLFSNTPPVLSAFTNYQIAANTKLGPMAFTVGDAETAATGLLLTAASSNTNLVPQAGLVLGGSGTNRTLTVTPAANRTGWVSLTVTASDGALAASRSFWVNIGAPNTPPTLSVLAGQATPEDTPLVVAFTVGDAETPAGQLAVTAGSTNTNVLAATGLVLGGTGSQRTLTLIPRPEAAGTATVTIAVSDGFLGTNRSFTFRVIPVNEPPAFVDLTSPRDGAVLAAGTALSLRADALDVDGDLARVEFFRDTVFLGMATNAPYQWTWAVPSPGRATLRAVATDSSGLAVASSPVRVTFQLPAVTLVSTGSVWNYFDRTNDLGSAWRAAGYDDSTWARGPAQLGFGDGDEATVVAGGGARLTTCFRRQFVVENPADFASLTLDLLRDDGAVVYLNEVEVFRSNMPAGTITPFTLAKTPAYTADESTTFYRALLSPSVLRAGTNVLAVEVHQAAATSGDLSFDLALRADPLPPQTLVAPGATWRYLDEGADPGPAWMEAGYDETGWKLGRAPLGHGDGDEATVLSPGSAAGAGPVTTWFRRAFFVPDARQIQALTASLLRDDGAVVYLNGTEVWRSNLPVDGPITPATLAATAIDGTNENTWLTASLNPALLVDGTNLLAVEIHQDSTTPDDSSFDFALTALSPVTLPNLPPEVLLTQPRDGVYLPAPGVVTLEAFAFDPDGTVATVGFLAGDVPLAERTAPPFSMTVSNLPVGDHVFSATAMDTEGAGATAAVPTVVRVRPVLSPAFIPAGSDWRYFDRTNDPGPAWRSPAFSDVTWSNGPARLGYGGDGEVTVLGPSRPWTTYFRRAFYVPTPAFVLGLQARLTRDDAAVLYLNGTELWRDTNLTSGTLTHLTPALTALNRPEETNWFTLTLPAFALDLLQPGWNLLAAEVHNASLTNGDLGFDCELTASTLLPAPPVLSLQPQPSALSLAWPADALGFALQVTTNLAPPVRWIPATNTPVPSHQQWRVTLPAATNGSRFFRLQGR